jgi:hypothetical protein
MMRVISTPLSLRNKLQCVLVANEHIQNLNQVTGRSNAPATLQESTSQNRGRSSKVRMGAIIDPTNLSTTGDLKRALNPASSSTGPFLSPFFLPQIQLI